jgi:hypothetical protein
MGASTAATQHRSLSTLTKGEDTSNRAFWTAASAGTAALVGGSVAWTLCDQQQQPSGKPIPAFGRRYTTHGIRDPMTSYARYAMEREMKDARKKDNISKVGPGFHATSSSSDAPKMQDVSILDMSQLAVPERTESEEKIEQATRKAKKHSGGLKVFSGNGNMALSLEIARHLGINLGKATVGRFADGEVNCVIHENVRGKDIYIVQPTCPPVNDNIMELLLMVSTLRRASARRITVVIPYYGYARQDRKMQVSRSNISLLSLRNESFTNVIFLVLRALAGPCPHFGGGRGSSLGIYGS